MRIFLESGDPFVWQWQPKEHIVLEGYPDGVFVHYANCNTAEAPVVQSRRVGDKLIADIPPELMQEALDITVYVCDEDGTRHCHFLPVLSRPKPESYVTEPVEILRYESLAKRIKSLEEGGIGGVALDTTLTQSGKAADAKATGDAIKHITKNIPTKPEDIGAQPKGDYLTESPVESVNGKTGAVKLSASDVGALPEGTKIPAKISDLPNDAGFVNRAVSNLENYYTQTQTRELIAAIPKFRVSVVQQLPGTGEELVLYLVPFATAQGQYLEYIWVDNQWEVIGSQQVDLTGYATETYVQQAIPPAVNNALEEAKRSGEFDGEDGEDGEDGITPHIGDNGNWFTGSTDTGVPATGPQGEAGVYRLTFTW